MNKKESGADRAVHPADRRRRAADGGGDARGGRAPARYPPDGDRAAQHADQRRRLRDGTITLTSFCRRAGGSGGLGLADRVYKVKYVFERGTTLAPRREPDGVSGGQARGEGHAALCLLRAVREARGACLSLCRRRKDERRNRAARARHGRRVSPRGRGVGGGCPLCRSFRRTQSELV